MLFYKWISWIDCFIRHWEMSEYFYELKMIHVKGNEYIYQNEYMYSNNI